MYAGHAAVALALKAREPRLPILPLAIACFGPDWLEMLLLLRHSALGMPVYTHSIPAVIVGASLAAGVYAAFRRPGADLIFLGWLLHWPADIFTGRKPVFASAPLVGLDLYKLPLADFALESIVVVVACVLYARRFAPRAELRRPVVILAAALLLLQAAVDASLALMRKEPWTPTLVLGRWQSQLTLRAGRLGPTELRMPFAPHSSHIISERAMAEGPRGVVTLVCLTCGKEKFFTGEVPAAVTCEQCGSTVFRTFATPTEPDEAAIDALEAQARSMAYGDSSPDTTQDDVRDLDMR